MNNENYAVIDLTIDSKDFKEENIIHKNEFEQAKKLIQEQVPENLQDITKNDDFEGAKEYFTKAIKYLIDLYMQYG